MLEPTIEQIISYRRTRCTAPEQLGLRVDIGLAPQYNDWASSAGVAQLAERLFCKQHVAGSSPVSGSSSRVIFRFGDALVSCASPFLGSVSEWLKEAVCKIVGESLRRFESCPAHHVLAQPGGPEHVIIGITLTV